MIILILRYINNNNLDIKHIGFDNIKIITRNIHDYYKKER